MGRNNWYKIVENVEILDIAAEGKAIARIENMVIFLPYVVPGDIVDVQIIRKRKNFLEGRVIKIVKLSEQRVEPFCSHFGICGGCKWQNLPYDKQLFYKEKQVKDQLERIGKIKIENVYPIIPSEKTTFYRNKLEFTFSNKRWLFDGESELPNETDYWGSGFHIPTRFDKVIDLKECFLQPEPSNSIRLAVSNYCKQNHFPFFDLKKQEGYIRNLIVRNTLDGQVMLIICFYYDNTEWQEKILSFVSENYPDINSLYYVVNSKHNDSLDGISPVLYKGKEYLTEQLGDLKFIISPKSFFQTNSRQTKVLYEKVLEFAELKGTENVYDLYSGTGTIGLFLAKHAKQVTGIECVEDAVNDARHNALLNGITNSKFYTGDTKDIFNTEFINKNGIPDIVILDPPRSGIHKDIIELLLSIKPTCIIYVSCNPATQARDIELLNNAYRVNKCQPVDMFPHTHHVENIVKLTVM
jgi:23S rRNA (uracil1939-C5)-methyltransferase